MAAIQRTYTVPLRKGYLNTSNWKKTNKAVSTLRIFLQRHTKREDVKIGGHLNDFLWKHGLKNPPARVKVDVWIEDDFAKAELSGKDYKEAIRPEKKKEDGGLKDKLAKKMGVDMEGKTKEDKSNDKPSTEIEDSKDKPSTDKQAKEEKRTDTKPMKEDTSKTEPAKKEKAKK